VAYSFWYWKITLTAKRWQDLFLSLIFINTKRLHARRGSGFELGISCVATVADQDVPQFSRFGYLHRIYMTRVCVF
jgi:hypothetical protein